MWNERERKVVEDGPDALTLGGVRIYLCPKTPTLLCLDRQHARTPLEPCVMPSLRLEV